ncbi:hypothetical protein GCM10010156_15740 [Planobispora rosea]|uniref:Protein kinase domain-containing protein n=1 Tax=Planobispora rosea TaxID=35762 RepID=A0A8J3WI28_PLARO|nr:protein kinase [Planobispora rosea]GGS58031.1 hypothetical protein GCM10010156_15740 [Planobispora rosea]GIH88456.1 hypothetical protein Pro02_68640 [Planobispora rosea]
MTDHRALSPEDPEQVGDYRIASVLGRGGQGIVYLGLTPSGGRVAVKVLHAHLVGDEQARRRFLREVDAARAVEEFCTARVLDTGLIGTRPYVVSEYVDGESLQDLIRRDGPRDPGGLHRLAIGTVAALAAVHRAGIVHRDFKPTNVLLSIDGPRVIDFGIARALDATATMTSGVVGTPAYMSPEQISGEPAGPASDVFSWALTMVYAATGKAAFGSDSVPSVMNRILNHEPDLSALPEPLRGIAARCLAKQPERRPSAAEVLRDLTGQGRAGREDPAGFARTGSVASPVPGSVAGAAPASPTLVEPVLPTRSASAVPRPGQAPPQAVSGGWTSAAGLAHPASPFGRAMTVMLRLCMLAGALAGVLFIVNLNYPVFTGSLGYSIVTAVWCLAFLSVTFAAWAAPSGPRRALESMALTAGIATAVSVLLNWLLPSDGSVPWLAWVTRITLTVWFLLLAGVFWRRSRGAYVLGLATIAFYVLSAIAVVVDGTELRPDSPEQLFLIIHRELSVLWLAWLAVFFRSLFSTDDGRIRKNGHAVGDPLPGGSARPAGWGARAGAFVVDGLFPCVPVLVLSLQPMRFRSPDLTFPILSLVVIVLMGLLIRIEEGAHGQTPGKRVAGIWLVQEESGLFVGAGTAMARSFCHIVDALPLGIGYLFPLWDPKGQTFADKITGTLVVTPVATGAARPPAGVRAQPMGR